MRRPASAALAAFGLVVIGGSHLVIAQAPSRPTTSAAQLPTGSGEVRGKVLESKSNSPIARASVTVRLKASTAIVAGAIAGTDGAFRIQGLRPGTYSLRATFIGFAPRVQEFIISNDAPVASLGAIALSQVAVALTGVAVTEERTTVTVEPDRNTYRAKDVAPAAGNASEVLDAVPSVSVDGDGKVSLRGNESVAVQINGRPSPLSGTQLGAYLKSLPANIIERVEVVPNPSAKYDPEGMAGIITIGSVGDYAHGDTLGTPFPDANVRHMTLKDIQVTAAGTITFFQGPQNVADGEVLNQEHSDFCNQLPASTTEVRLGSCAGVDKTAAGGDNYTGGDWYFTVSGQTYPTVRMTAPDGEIWRLTNASGSLSYDLKLVDDASQAPLTVQLLSVDGVSVHLPQDTPMGTMVQLAGGKFRVVACPAVPAIGFHSVPICVNEIVMMPSARTEVWVTWRNAAGAIVPPPAGSTATLKMVGLTMGSGDQWPAVDLAKIRFDQGGPRQLISFAMDIIGDALAAMQPTGIFTAPVPYAKAAPLPAGCTALAPGHRRRIFFGFSDLAVNNTFGLGYEELDQNGNVVPGTQIPVTRFDPSNNIICLPLGPGQTPVHETWELVQLSTENHNFHIHQTRFRQVQASAPATSPLAAVLDPAVGGGIIQDNLPLGVAVPDATISDTVANDQNGVCSIDQWRSGHCASTPVVLDIPFSQLGEFVYHCHILEHEDGGMMAKIQVVASPN